MPKLLSVRYIGPHDEVFIQSLGATVARGSTFEVSAVVAGRAPSDWRDRADGDPDGWPVETAEDGAIRTQDPGDGLLAQSGLFELVTAGGEG